ncbi:hypothetical protein [Paenibacillus silvestris]|nr:hypothetical protein [Paenibacillus silvestris]
MAIWELWSVIPMKMPIFTMQGELQSFILPISREKRAIEGN